MPAHSIQEEVKQMIIKRLDSGAATWGEVCGDVAKRVEVAHAYVERIMGEMVRGGQVKKISTPGFPKYAAMGTAPAAVEGKYKPFTERRLEAETKSETFEDNPWNRDIKGPNAV